MSRPARLAATSFAATCRNATGLLLATGLALAAGTATAASFTWSTNSEPSTMDPHGAATAPVLGFLNNIYEGLVRRGRDMTLEPSLATAWEPIGDEGWRFFLREGVTFHDGSGFDAGDVVFSFERAASEQSDVKTFFATIDRVAIEGPMTVAFYTTQPDPLFVSGIANWFIMDEGWTTAKGAERPNIDGTAVTNVEANGTGPFRLIRRTPDSETVLEPHAGWWDEPEHNLTRAVYQPLAAAGTRVAALLSKAVDMIEPVPLQDVPRIESTPGFEVITGIESRVIFFGFDHASDSLRLGDAGGSNPLQDARVRRAIYQAIDAEAIVERIMRGQARLAGLLIGPGVDYYKAEDDTRLPLDIEAAKALLAEAGHADGFSLTLRCPNDRYINDEAICTAIPPMLAQIGIEVDVVTVPVSQYWGELRDGLFDMYLLGWSPGTFDAEHPMRFLLASPNEELRLGSWNFGNYENERIDELVPRIQQELDAAARQAMIDEVHAIMQDEVAYVPLHVQPLVWAVRAGVEVQQRPDNFFLLRWVRVDG